MNSKSSTANRITIGQLIEHLKPFDRDAEIIFGSDELSFYRTKQRGEKLVQIEFNEMLSGGKVVDLSTE